LQCHGDSDGLVAHSFGAMTSQLISSFNSNVQFKTYRGMDHSSCDEVKDDHRVVNKILYCFIFGHTDHFPTISTDRGLGLEN
jgi:lysophospholipase-2